MRADECTDDDMEDLIEEAGLSDKPIREQREVARPKVKIGTSLGELLRKARIQCQS